MPKFNWNMENIKKGLKHPTRAFDEVVLQYSFRLPLTAVNCVSTIGTNVFDREWDVLILLDTCRVDALRSVEGEYDFFDGVGHIWSAGGRTPEWIARTFDRDHLDEIQETAYLCANGHGQQILGDRRQEQDKEKYLLYKMLRLMPTVHVTDFGKCEYLFQFEWKGTEGPLGHVDGATPPRYVTDRAITVGREEEFERLVVHYFQPHSPWVANALDTGRELEKHEHDFWNYITETGDTETVWESYLDELRYVLDDVELLLENLDADRVVISSDHGEAFGEYGVLGHKIGSVHPKVRKVPWAVTTAEDSHSYQPTTEEPRERMSSEAVDRQLEALGYKD